MTTTLNPFSSNFTYAYQRDHAIEVTKAVVKSMLYVVAEIVTIATAIILAMAAPVAIAGIGSAGFTPLGAGLLITVIVGCSFSIYLGLRVSPLLIDRMFSQIEKTHHLIWN